MTKKLALFLFALGMGATSATVVASDAYYCIKACTYEYQDCLYNGGTSTQCTAERNVCVNQCWHPAGR
ncbi:MAG: hypothetical protein RL748_2742 [Pseudomonadota bacterium]|jgi:hypothetical protein